MATDPKKLPSLGALPASAFKKTKKPKKPSRPSRPVGRPAPLVALHDRYGLVYEPGEDADPIVKAELDALRELYRERTSREIADEEDTRAALERANLLRSPTRFAKAPKRAIEFRERKEEQSELFASAMDALDAVAKTLGTAGAGVLAPPSLLATTEVGRETISPFISRGIKSWITRNVEEAAENVPKATKRIGQVVGPPASFIGRQPGIPNADVGVSINPFDASQSRIGVDFDRQTVGENVASVGRGLAAGLEAGTEQLARLGELPVPRLYGTGLVGTPMQGATPRVPVPTDTRPAPLDRLGARRAKLKDVVQLGEDLAANPNAVISVSSDRSAKVAGAPEWFEDIANVAKTGAVDSSQLTSMILDAYAKSSIPRKQGAAEQAAGSPFSPNFDKTLLAFAVEEGWPAEEWASLTPGEKLFRAYTKNEYWKILGRTLLRAFGETAATPAAGKAIMDATVLALRGNPNDAVEIMRGVVAPIPKYYNTMQTRGIWAATAEFARDNPLEFALAVNLSLRTASRAGGAASRAIGSEYSTAGRDVFAEGVEVVSRPQPTPLPEVPTWQPERAGGTIFDQARAREEAIRERERIAAENAARERAYTEATTIEEQRAASDVTTVPVYLGTTTGRLFNDFMLQSVRKRIAEANGKYTGRIGKRYADILVGRRVAAETRWEANKRQGLTIEIQAILERALADQEGKRIRRPVDRWTKDRAAFNLVWAQETIGGERVTPGFVADYFKKEADDLRAELDGRIGEKKQQDQLAYWDAQEKYFRRLDEVKIDDATMARLREAAREFGRQNDVIVAAALNIPLSEVKRANYIRLLVIDPRFEARAQTRKRQANLEPTQLRIAQRNIRRLSEQMIAYADESGWGKAGPARSRRRFAESRDQLVAEIRTARRLAESLGDQELVRAFDDALAKMRLARNEASARAANVAGTLDVLDDLRLSDEQLARLSPDARAAYEQAQEAEADVARLTGERGVALEEAGLRRTNVAVIQAAERRVAEARDLVERRKNLPRPVAADVADAERRLADAEQRLARVSRAEELKEPLRIAEVSRDQKIAEAKRLINAGKTVLDDAEVKVALDVSQTLAAVRVRTRKDFDYYTISRARNETLDEFIARMEAQGKAPLLHLVQTRAMQNLGSAVMVRDKTRLRADVLAMVRGGRLKESEGFTFAQGYEDPNLWRNLMFDTSELISSAGWSNGITRILNATSVRFSFKPEVIEEAKKLVEDGVVVADDDLRLSADSVALGEVIRSRSIIVDMADVVVIPPFAPTAVRPVDRIPKGAIEQMDPDSIGALTLRQITERDIDPDAPGDYYIIPKAVYRAMLDTVNDEAFRFRPSQRGGAWRSTPYYADKITRLWRTFTLNVFPRTAMVNMLGSTTLALQAGAGPRAMQYAAMAILGVPIKMADGTYRKLPVPPELRQRYYEQLTDPVTAKRISLEELPEPTAKDAAMAWGAWYMNSMRYLNGMSEDLGRLAVWYHKAYPEAIAASSNSRVWFKSAKKLNDGAIDMLEAMARGDEEWRVKHQRWVRQSFDFLGDLHRGGQTQATIRIAMPFWQWYRHMLILTFYTLPVKYPGRALFFQQLGQIGAEYQEKHGVMVPWGWSFIPWMTNDEELAGNAQLITGGIDVTNVLPAATYGQYITREGDIAAPKMLNDFTNPLISNSLFIAGSFISGNALEFDERKFARAAKDEFGLDIKGRGDSQFWNYIANRAFRMVPLSPSLMSAAGRATTSLPFPGQVNDKYVANDDIERPKNDRVRSDLLALGAEPWDYFYFFSKILVGIRYDEMEGIGPVARKRLLDTAEILAREKSQQENKMRIAFLQAQTGETSRVGQP